VSGDLLRLAQLLTARDALDGQIAELVGRPARPGDVGEFIAAQVFDLELAASATQAGYDGIFRSGRRRATPVGSAGGVTAWRPAWRRGASWCRDRQATLPDHEGRTPDLTHPSGASLDTLAESLEYLGGTVRG
jgi:hypothetical protein